MKGFRFHLSTLCIITLILAVLLFAVVRLLVLMDGEWRPLGEYEMVNSKGNSISVQLAQQPPARIPGCSPRVRCWIGGQRAFNEAVPFRFGVSEVRVSSDGRRLFLFSSLQFANVVVLEEHRGRLVQVTSVPWEAKVLCAQFGCVWALTCHRDEYSQRYFEAPRLRALRQLASFSQLDARAVSALEEVAKDDASEKVRRAARELLLRRHG